MKKNPADQQTKIFLKAQVRMWIMVILMAGGRKRAMSGNQVRLTCDLRRKLIKDKIVSHMHWLTRFRDEGHGCYATLASGGEALH